MRAVLIALALAASPAAAQPVDAANLAGQREGMKPLTWMLGSWRGEAWRTVDGVRHRLIQTERVTTMPAGGTLLLDGRAFEIDGRPTDLNAVGTIAYSPSSKTYIFRTTAAPGRFPVWVSGSSWSWSMPAGAAHVRFTSTYEAGVWREMGELIAADGTTTPIFEMKLKRLPD